jgi:Leucine-rich repeat (LRR) protein
MTPQQTLVVKINALERCVKDARSQLHQINEPQLPENIASLLKLTDDLRGVHTPLPDACIADDFANLRGLFAQVNYGDDLPDRAVDDRLRILKGLVGTIYIEIDSVLLAAGKMGLLPTRPEQQLPVSALVNKSEYETTLKALVARVAEMEKILNEQIVPQGRGNHNITQQQVTIVQNYTTEMNKNITIFDASVNVGDIIDLTVVERITVAMSRATVNFVATVRASSSQATAQLKAAAENVGKSVKRVTNGVKNFITRVIRMSVTKDISIIEPENVDLEAITDFDDEYDEDLAISLILSGRPIPDSWVAYIESFSLHGEQIIDINLLKNLKSLYILDLSNTTISDISALAGLTNLSHLDLSGTAIADLSALAGLTKLHRLNISDTDVSDLQPLVGLKALYTLDASGTNITDFKPLTMLHQLSSLDLSDTKINDLSVVSNLRDLSMLTLSNTSIVDISPLSGLTELGRLDLSGTEIMDLTPLVDLPELVWLILQGVGPVDLGPLARLRELEGIDIQYSLIADLSPLKVLNNLKTIRVESLERARLLSVSLGRDTGFEIVRNGN